MPPNGLSAPISLPTQPPRRCASLPGERLDLSCASVRMVMQEPIEIEAEQRIGTVRHECTATESADRNGSMPRLGGRMPGTCSVGLWRRAGHNIKRYADSGQTARSWT